jgi:hypothetical protein
MGNSTSKQTEATEDISISIGHPYIPARAQQAEDAGDISSSARQHDISPTAKRIEDPGDTCISVGQAVILPAAMQSQHAQHHHTDHGDAATLSNGVIMPARDGSAAGAEDAPATAGVHGNGPVGDSSALQGTPGNSRAAPAKIVSTGSWPTHPSDSDPDIGEPDQDGEVIILDTASKATEVTSAKQEDLEPLIDLASATDGTSVREEDSEPPADVAPAKQEALEPAAELAAAARQPRLSAEQVMISAM